MAPPSRRLRLGALSPAMTRLIFAGLGAAILAWTGLRVTASGNANRIALREARAALARYDGWRRAYQPPSATEPAAWRRSGMEAQQLGIVGDERLELTQAISRAAEIAGLRDVRVRVVPSDTTGSEARLSTEGVQRSPASFGLLVEGRGSLQAMANLLGRLPSSVAATNLHLVRQDGRARHQLQLAVYEVSFSNGISSVSPSAERGDSDPRGGGRGGR
jgi:hypothetical protein